MKKLLALVLSLVLVCACLTACGDKASDKKDVKVGFIFIGDENEGYTAAHYEGAKAMQKELGLSDDQILIKWTIPENEQCFDAACELAEAGCNIIFANSFGHEKYIINAAKEYPDVQFCHATGYQAAGSGLSNMHNYFTSIYEARYVSGVVAGVRLNEMVANGDISKDDIKVGYVGAYPYAEVVSGYTSFYLGILSSCAYDVTMDVQYTTSWGNQALEKEAAEALIASGCVLIGQHADTTGAPSACQAKGVNSVGYNIDMTSVAPDYALTSSTNNWSIYVTYAVKCVMDGEKIDVDWCKGYADGAVAITEINKKAFAGEESYNAAVAAAQLAIDGLKAGTLHVFDTSTFTVDGKEVTTYADDAGNEYIKDGYFQESTLASAPAFALRIDGITELNPE